MISIKDLREYSEALAIRTDGVNSVTMVSVDKDMSDALRRMKAEEFPALFVVVPSSDDESEYPDIVEETSQCLLFLLDRSDNQRRTPIQVLEETQETVETLKQNLRGDAARPCHFMAGLRNLSTNPETGLYSDYCGWSVSFNIDGR